jgi:hypothetical protein
MLTADVVQVWRITVDFVVGSVPFTYKIWDNLIITLCQAKSGFLYKITVPVLTVAR